jgi:hypothetical protein
LAAGGWWSLLPPSEQKLMARLTPLMESDSKVDWKRAKDLIAVMKENYPQSEFLQHEVRDFEAKVLMEQAETRATNNERLGRPPDSEAERLYSEAWEYETTGDRMTAWDKYQGLIDLIGDSKDEFDQAFVRLARTRIEKIRNNPDGAQSQYDFVRGRLEEAKKYQAAGDIIKARSILENVVKQYGNNQELQSLVDQARSLMQSLSGRN